MEKTNWTSQKYQFRKVYRSKRYQIWSFELPSFPKHPQRHSWVWNQHQTTDWRSEDQPWRLLLGSSFYQLSLEIHRCRSPLALFRRLERRSFACDLVIIWAVLRPYLKSLCKIVQRLRCFFKNRTQRTLRSRFNWRPSSKIFNVIIYIFSANPDLASILKKAFSSNHVILAVPTHKIAELGINPNYSYSFLNQNAKGNLELRNSWGTIEEKPKVNLKNDGSFEISSALAKDNISHFLIARINKSYWTTTIQSRHKLGFYSSYKFNVRQ